MLELALQIRRGPFALEVSAQAPGGCTVVFGASGAGKTSLARAVAGLDQDVTGRIVVDGAVLLDTSAGINLAPQDRRIGYVFQEPRLFPHLSVRGNLLYGAPRGADPGPIAEMLDIAPLCSRRPRALSGGEASRVALGRALMRRPRLLVLDEPLSALDQARKDAILPYLARLRDEAGVGMLYITHAIEEVMRLGTTMMLLSRGRVAKVGPVAEVLSDPRSAHDLGPRLAGAVLRGRIGQVADGLAAVDTPAGLLWVPTPGLPVGAEVQLRVLAQDVILATQKPQALSALNLLPARIAQIEEGSGPGVMVQLQAGDGQLLARVTKRSAQALGLAPGQAVYAVIKAVSLAPSNLVPLHEPLAS